MVELGGLRTTYPDDRGRSRGVVAAALGASFGIQALLRLLGDGTGDLVMGVVAALGGALAVVAVVDARRSRVVLDPEGVVRRGLLTSRVVRPWSTVGEVRPPSRWVEHAEIRGTSASVVPMALPEMTAEEARELQRRLEDARSRTGRGAPPP